MLQRCHGFIRVLLQKCGRDRGYLLGPYNEGEEGEERVVLARAGGGGHGERAEKPVSLRLIDIR